MDMDIADMDEKNSAEMTRVSLGVDLIRDQSSGRPPSTCCRVHGICRNFVKFSYPAHTRRPDSIQRVEFRGRFAREDMILFCVTSAA